MTPNTDSLPLVGRAGVGGRRPAAPSPRIPLLEIENLRLRFSGYEGPVQVLNGINLAVARGESVGIVGETGCGKSVLARAVLRLDKAAELTGAIRFDASDVLTMTPPQLRALRGAGIGMVFQDPATYLNPVFTIGRHLAEVLRAHNVTTIRARSIELLASVGLPDEVLLNRYPHELSGGMRQRVLIALALAANPRLLLADEPTTALDVTVQLQVLRLIADLVDRLGLTLVLISHDLGVIGAMCRRVVVMYAGAIVEDGPAEQVLDAPRHPYTQGLLASVPDLERPGAVLRGIAGSIPSLRHPPPGCRFEPRCPVAVARCRVEVPALRGGAACHLVAA